MSLRTMNGGGTMGLSGVGVAERPETQSDSSEALSRLRKGGMLAARRPRATAFTNLTTLKTCSRGNLLGSLVGRGRRVSRRTERARPTGEPCLSIRPGQAARRTHRKSLKRLVPRPEIQPRRPLRTKPRETNVARLNSPTLGAAPSGRGPPHDLGPRGRPEIRPQSLEKVGFTPGNPAVAAARERQTAPDGPCPSRPFDRGPAPPGRGPPHDLGPRGRPEIRPQNLEKVGFAPGNPAAAATREDQTAPDGPCPSRPFHRGPAPPDRGAPHDLGPRGARKSGHKALERLDSRPGIRPPRRPVSAKPRQTGLARLDPSTAVPRRPAAGRPTTSARVAARKSGHKALKMLDSRPESGCDDSP